MSTKKLKLSKRAAQVLRDWRHTISCKPCGIHFTWIGKAQKQTDVEYLRKSCGKPMSVKNWRKENE